MESYTEFMNWKIHHYWHLLFTNLFTYPLNLSDNHNEIFFLQKLRVDSKIYMEIQKSYHS